MLTLSVRGGAHAVGFSPQMFGSHQHTIVFDGDDADPESMTGQTGKGRKLHSLLKLRVCVCVCVVVVVMVMMCVCSCRVWRRAAVA